MSGDTENIDFYRKRAADLRAVAERLNTAEAKDLLRRTADNYDRLALNLERRGQQR